MEQISRPAATAHSLNRKDRKRPKGKKRANSWAVKKELIVQAVAAGHTHGEAAEGVGMNPNGKGIKTLAKGDPNFAQDLAEAEKEAAIARARAAGYLDGELLEVAREWREIGKTTQDERLRADVDWKHLKGRGVLTERIEQEVRGIIGVFNADDLAREFREAKKRLSEGSG